MEVISLTNSAYPPSRDSQVNWILKPNVWDLEAFDTIYDGPYVVKPKQFEAFDIVEVVKKPEWNKEGIRVRMIEEGQYEDVIKFVIEDCALYHTVHGSMEAVILDPPALEYLQTALEELLKETAGFVAEEKVDGSRTGVLLMSRPDPQSCPKRFWIQDTPFGPMMGMHGEVSDKCARILQLLNISRYNILQSVMVTPRVSPELKRRTFAALLTASSKWAEFQEVECVLARCKCRDLKRALLESSFRAVPSVSRLDWYDDEDQKHGYTDPRARLNLQVFYFIRFIGEDHQKTWRKYKLYYTNFH